MTSKVKLVMTEKDFYNLLEVISYAHVCSSKLNPDSYLRQIVVMQTDEMLDLYDRLYAAPFVPTGETEEVEDEESERPQKL